MCEWMLLEVWVNVRPIDVKYRPFGSIFDIMCLTWTHSSNNIGREMIVLVASTCQYLDLWSKYRRVQATALLSTGYACAHTCGHAYAHADTCRCMHLHVYAHAYACVCVHVHACTCMHLGVHMGAQACVHMPTWVLAPMGAWVHMPAHPCAPSGCARYVHAVDIKCANNAHLFQILILNPGGEAKLLSQDLGWIWEEMHIICALNVV